MPMQAVEIEAMIKQSLPDARVEIRDLAGDGDHYAATIVARGLPGQDPRPAAPDGLCRAQGEHGRRAARPCADHQPAGLTADGDRSLYDTDIVAWSEQQAEALRDLARQAGKQSNAVDWDNLIDEVETVGRSESGGGRVACAKSHPSDQARVCPDSAGLRRIGARKIGPSSPTCATTTSPRCARGSTWTVSGRAPPSPADDAGRSKAAASDCPQACRFAPRHRRWCSPDFDFDLALRRLHRMMPDTM